MDLVHSLLVHMDLVLLCMHGGSLTCILLASFSVLLHDFFENWSSQVHLYLHVHDALIFCCEYMEARKTDTQQVLLILASAEAKPFSCLQHALGSSTAFFTQ